MTEHKLPVRQLIILCTLPRHPRIIQPANKPPPAICRFAEPIALTSVSPYIPEMLESFGVETQDIAKWAGAASAIFSICQAFTGLLWGAVSDRYGRKPIILIGLFNTLWTMLLWGFSTNLPMALAARALQGLGNGNVGILRTTVAELCPWKELQPRAFSIMPLVYGLGAMIGPTLGGALSNPLQVDPRRPHGHSFLEKFPYILPNLVAAAFFAIGIVVGWLFLKESMEGKKHNRDLGLITGIKITTFFRNALHAGKSNDSERERLLDQRKAYNETVQTHGVASEIAREDAPKIRDVLTYQTTLNLVVYTLLALYTLAYDQLLPVLLHHPPQSINDPNVQLPFKFAGGFGMDSRRIGVMFTIFAVSSTICQFFLFPPMARWLGITICMRISFIFFPCVYFVTPFVTLISDPSTREAVMIALLMIRGVGGTFAFPTSTIMLTNSASSLRVLGTINGLATSVGAIGRAAGPAVGGGLFTWGIKRGYVIVPFWALSAIAFLAAIPTFWLVEGKGFGDDPDEDEERMETNADDGANGGTEPQSIPVDNATQSESEFGDFTDEPVNLLSRTSTRSSAAIISDDEEEGSRSSNVLSSARSHSHSRKPIVRRRSSVPIGMGQGFRRLSSNLGSTGVGGGGSSWGGT
jgi:MFS family permease